MAAEMTFFCAGCNRTTQALSWSHQNGCIAYGACTSVVLYKPAVEKSTFEIVALLNKHNARVNCIQWLENGKCSFLVSGSSDGSIILWNEQNDKWNHKQTMNGHTSSVISLSCLTYLENNEDTFLIASSSSDSTVKIWTAKESQEFTSSQTLSFGGGFAHTVASSTLPINGGVIVACGCDDTTVKLYTKQSNEYANVMTLNGHEDWVRCLAFKLINGNLLLASGSQDMYVRLWKISLSASRGGSGSSGGGGGGGIGASAKDDIIALEEQLFQSYDKEYMVVLDSVLIGHEGWVQGVSWNPNENSACLLTASMDRTLIVWEYSVEDGVWLDKARMGEVGGNTLGYYGCAFGSHGDSLIAHGFHGAFNMWRRNIIDGKVSSSWKASITISGHFNEVEDFDWDPYGEFVITASSDQTTRLFAPWTREGLPTTWHEIARPQIHGYDMKCITMLGRYKYASGAQEKVARIFGAPKAFYDSLTYISNTVMRNDEEIDALPLGATVPVLGLSNKAVYEADIESWQEKKETSPQPMKASAFANEDPAPFNPSLIKEPPIEDVLLQNTLWPETQKLYGHGFELFCMTSSPDGDVLATACKASKPEHANILIWNTTTWTQADNIQNAHALTITQMCFSPNGKYLLSVSRDRTWALHQRQLDEQDQYKFSLVQKSNKKNGVHTRIVWSCDWFPGDQYFVTASRDKKVVVWGKSMETQYWCPQGDTVDVGQSVTAVSCSPQRKNNERYIVAVGTEIGQIYLYTWLRNWIMVQDIHQSMTPCLTVKRLRWRRQKTPCTGDSNSDNKSYYLGICSSDHSFRILQFDDSIISQHLSNNE